MKFIYLIFCFLPILLFGDGGNSQIIFDKSNSIKLKEYCISISREASEQELYAANTLISELKSVYNIKLKIVYETNIKGKFISIGSTLQLQKCLSEIKFNENLADDDSVVLPNNGNVYLFGGKGRGTFYAVCSFLETELNIYYLGDNFYSNKNLQKTISVSYRVERPAFDSRAIFYSNSLDLKFGARNRLNILFEKAFLSDSLPSNDLIGPSGTHTFDQLVPKNEYYYTKPELFSDKDDKNRSINNCTQLCLTNSETEDITYNSIIKYLTSHPKTKYINIAPNDCKNECCCSKCSAVNLEEKSNFGTLARFLNKIAERLKSSSFKVKILSLSYLDLDNAPQKTHLNENIIIRISTDTISWYHPFSPIRKNKEFAKRIKEWNKVCNNLWVYDYACNFDEYLQIYPNIFNLADNFKYYKEVGFKGITLESFYENKGVEESELRAFVFSRLAINPKQDVFNLLSFFCDQFYGIEAGKIMKKYYNYLYHKINFASLTYSEIDSMFDTDDILFFKDVISKLSNVKSNTQTKKRLDRWMIGIKYTIVKNYSQYLEANEYQNYLNDIQRTMSENKFIKLGSFKANTNEFFRINLLKLKFRKGSNNSQRVKKVIVDPSMLTINTLSGDSLSTPYIIFDPKSTTGIAVRIPANNQEWLVRFFPNKKFCVENNMKKIILRVKYVGDFRKEDERTWVYCFGAYNYITKEHPLEKFISLKDVGTEYNSINLGEISLKEGLEFFIFPITHPNLKYILFDSIQFQ